MYNITLSEVTHYIDNLYTPLSDEHFTLRKEGEERGVPILLKDTEELILNCMRLKMPKRILEIGTAIGYSAICFASLSKEIQVTSLELKEEMVKKAQVNIGRFGLLSQIHIMLGDAKKSLNKLVLDYEENKNGFDMVFIDAAKAQYRFYFEESLKMLNPGAVIFSDNVLFKGMTASDAFFDKKNKTIIKRMREYLNYITTLNHVTTSVLPVGDGVAMSYIK